MEVTVVRNFKSSIRVTGTNFHFRHRRKDGALTF
nr:MAG TPA: hypothetical protein [Caudoviricetes sp.]